MEGDVVASVIVPVYNDPEGLQTTVRSLLSQTYGRFEIIIADNGSTDETLDVARTFAEQTNVSYVVEDDIQSSYAARNAGIEAATGEMVGFLDADMWVEEDYVESITHAMRQNDASYMGCKVEIVDVDGSTGRYNAATGFQINTYIERKNFVPTCCLVVYREVFEEVGNFDERLQSGGDLEFGQRVARAGIDQHYEPEITVYHPARNTVGQILKKSARVGKGNEQLHHYYPQRFQRRWLFNPRNILPVHPIRFKEKLQSKPVSYFELGYWYFLAWVMKVSSFIGQTSEYVSQIIQR